MKTETVPFSDSENDDWEITNDGAVRKDKKYYEIVLVKVNTNSECFCNHMVHHFAQDGI